MQFNGYFVVELPFVLLYKNLLFAILFIKQLPIIA